MAEFKDRLNEALTLRNMTAAELSRLAKVNEGAISQYKKGTYKATQENLERLAQTLRVSIPWLMGADVPTEKSYDHMVPDGFLPPPETVKRPRLGAISCGEPLMSEENFDGYDDVPTVVRCDFTLIAQGDSMTGAGIFDGDIVYIQQQPIVENGEIAAVLVDGCEKLLKRVYFAQNSVVLQAENPAYPPLTFSLDDMNNVQIIGKATGFTRISSKRK